VRIPLLGKIADSRSAHTADRIKALDLLAKVGMGGQPLNVDDARDRLTCQTTAIIEYLGTDAPGLLQILAEIWS
jgi:hypothetical protein